MKRVDKKSRQHDNGPDKSVASSTCVHECCAMLAHDEFGDSYGPIFAPCQGIFESY